MHLELTIAQAGGGGGSWIQWISILLVLGLTVLSWLFQKISEQAQKKKQLDLQQRRELEHLRTGRDPGEHRDSPKQAPQRELPARRQAQIEELRRRQQARLQRQPTQTGPATARPPQPARTTPPVVFIPGSSGPIVVTPRRPAPPQRPPVPQQRQPQPPRPPARQPVPRPPARPQRQARSPMPRQQGRAQDHPEEGSQTHRLLADTPHGESATQPLTPAFAIHKQKARAMGVPRTPADWRRAIIAREILSPPLSLRGPDADPLL